jgi:glycosyltransferase involved in cell wall biosynthesis
MRILHILRHVRASGNGIVNAVVDLACAQAEKGHSITVVSTGGEYEELLARFDVGHYTIEPARKPGSILAAAATYRRILTETKPEIVHAHMVTEMLVARACGVGVDHRLISTVHNSFARHTGRTKAVAFALAHRVIAVSDAVASEMCRHGLPKRKVRVVLNGSIGSPRRKPLHEYSPLPLQRPAITTVAGLYPRKGIDDLIQAFVTVTQRVQDAHLYIVGDGPQRGELERQARATPVGNRIHFEGFQAEPQRYLLSTDVFVLGSHREPFGLVLLEAREAGCAIVASNVDGIPEVLDHGHRGFLVNPAQPDEFAHRITTLLQNERLILDWRKRAQHDLGRFKVSRVADETLAVYQESLNERSPLASWA